MHLADVCLYNLYDLGYMSSANIHSIVVIYFHFLLIMSNIIYTPGTPLFQKRLLSKK